jgi:CRISPR-associated protein (TIGR02584 family)
MEKKIPNRYPRRVLLAVSGLSPQILTETLYVLARHTEPAFVPTEIILITTKEGAERARLYLLSEDPGWFHHLCEDYELGEITFDEAHIHVLKNRAGDELDDIRTADDNTQAADTILELVRRITADPDSALHVSIAGGRKTMGFYAGYALSLFGREQDRLSHVLVSGPYEFNPDFFYPTPKSRIIHTYGPDSRPLDSSQAEVSLAEIPFVRLRPDLPERMISESFSFRDTVAAAQKQQEPPSLTIDRQARTILAGNEVIHLPPAEFAFYSWLVERKLLDLPPIHWTDEGLGEAYLEHYSKIVGKNSGDCVRVETALKEGMKKEYFDYRKAKTNGGLKEALGARAAEPYLIKPHGSRPRTRFAVTLSAESITCK